MEQCSSLFSVFIIRDTYHIQTEASYMPNRHDVFTELLPRKCKMTTTHYNLYSILKYATLIIAFQVERRADSFYLGVTSSIMVSFFRDANMPHHQEEVSYATVTQRAPHWSLVCVSVCVCACARMCVCVDMWIWGNRDG